MPANDLEVGHKQGLALRHHDPVEIGIIPTIYLSVVVAAELAIKVGKGRIILPKPVEKWIEEAARRHHLTLLHLELGPAATAGGLPWIHSDPFDRILIATAQRLLLTMITADETIARYPGIKSLW